MTAVALAVAVLAFYALFYRKVVRHWGRAAEWVVDRLHLSATRSVRELEAIGKLAAAGVAQALFAAILLLVRGTDLSTIVALQPDLIALGAVLGIGELALATFLCTAIVRLAELRGRGAAVWVAQSRGGWMGHFGATVTAAPAWFALASICLYVGGEELVFRGLVIDAAASAGAVLAVGLSLVLFVVVQAFNMPSLRAATFPMIGAVVVGTVHGVLFWQTHDVLPLVVAHVTYFAGALTLASGPRSMAPAR